MVCGSYLGEVEVLFNIPRSYDAVASDEFEMTEVLSIEKVKLIELLESYPEVVEEMVVYAKVKKL